MQIGRKCIQLTRPVLCCISPGHPALLSWWLLADHDVDEDGHGGFARKAYTTRTQESSSIWRPVASHPVAWTSPSRYPVAWKWPSMYEKRTRGCETRVTNRALETKATKHNRNPNILILFHKSIFRQVLHNMSMHFEACPAAQSNHIDFPNSSSWFVKTCWSYLNP